MRQFCREQSGNGDKSKLAPLPGQLSLLGFLHTAKVMIERSLLLNACLVLWLGAVVSVAVGGRDQCGAPVEINVSPDREQIKHTNTANTTTTTTTTTTIFATTRSFVSPLCHLPRVFVVHQPQSSLHRL